jgi:hypothetical protein
MNVVERRDRVYIQPEGAVEGPILDRLREAANDAEGSLLAWWTGDPPTDDDGEYVLPDPVTEDDAPMILVLSGGRA